MKHTDYSPALWAYMQDISLREHPILKKLREETAKLPLAMMQISPFQGQFLQMLIKLLRGKRVLELGTYTGYSALSMALALPDDGQLITCDINTESVHIAQQYFLEAKQEHKIQIRLAPALDSLNALLDEGYSHQFDLIFIDADKTNYVDYYELALELIQPEGIIAIDNIFWDGYVIDLNDTSAQTREIRRLNQLIKKDDRVDISLLPIADGLFLIRLKEQGACNESTES